VTGVIDPSRIVTNAGSLPGDVLVLTKPLGIGILTSGIKFNRTSAESADRIIQVMSALNRTAAEVMVRFRSHGATDITGNGLLGHAYEMACASGVTLRFDAARVPYLEEAYRLAEEKLLPRTIRTTWKMIEADTDIAPTVPEPLRNILLDPQTSGGLLISVHSEDAAALVRELREKNVEAVEIGRAEELGRMKLQVR